MPLSPAVTYFSFVTAHASEHRKKYYLLLPINKIKLNLNGCGFSVKVEVDDIPVPRLTTVPRPSPLLMTMVARILRPKRQC